MRLLVLFSLIILTTIVGCSRVPLTGRKQLNLVAESELLALSAASYAAFLDSSTVVRGTANARMVEKVGKRVQNAATQFLAENGMAGRIEGFDWTFKLIQDPQANAWCMPGGKVAFYTGILPITQTETGMAVVMGHEIAHAIARHGNERMSQGLAAQLGGVALGVAIKDKPAETQTIFNSAYGIGAQLGVLLPFSRTHESEADRLGLVFMAMAGYDPHEALAFWQRMDAQSSGLKAPEFLSTHPDYRTRIANIEQHYLPEAMRYYQAATGKKGRTR